MKLTRKIKKITAIIMAIVMSIVICPLTNIIADTLSTDKLCLQVVESGIPVADTNNISCAYKNTEEGLSDNGSTSTNGIWETSYTLGDEYEGGNDFVFNIDGEEYFINIDLRNAKQYLIFDITNKSYSWSDEEITIDKLIQVIQPSPIIGIENGVPKTKEDLQLPDKISIITSGNTINEASVIWDVSGCDYISSKVVEQNFTVYGTLTLPETIKNIDNISLQVQVNVNVKQMPDAIFTTQPTSSTNLYVDEVLSLTVETKNADETTYQWYKGTEKIVDQTSNILTLQNVKLEDAGNYHCKVKSLNGTVVSSEIAEVKVSKITPNLAISTNVPSPQTKPIDSIVLSAVGVNDDASGTFTFYVNDVEKYKGTEKEYTFMVPDEDILSYSFKVVYSGNDTKYNSKTANITFSLKKGNQSKPSIELSKETMKDIDDTLPTVSVSGGNGKGKYIYAIGEEYDLDNNKLESPIGATLVADINEVTGKLTVKRSGKFKVTVYKEGDNNYNSSEIVSSKIITVGKKAQTGFKLEKTNVETKYATGKIINNQATGGESTGKIIYKVETGNDVVKINDSNSSAITLLKSGEAVIKVTHYGDDVYADTELTYTISVEKAEQELEFDIPNPQALYYGEKTFSNKVRSTDSDENDISDAEGNISYEILSGSNIASINSETGKLSFKDGQIGAIKVKAKREACSRYNEAEGTYVLNVIDESVPSPAYTIDGTKSSADNEWYIDNITIKPAEGYEIGTTNLLDGVYKDELVISEEGDDNGLVVYLRNKENGNITAGGIVISSSLLQIDKTKPTNIQIEYIGGSWTDDIWSNLSYGFYSQNVKIKISATDLQSGISELWWRYDKQNHENPLLNEDYVSEANRESDEIDTYVKCSDIISDGKDSYAEIYLPAVEAEQLRGNITVMAVNNAGISALNKDQRVVIVDSISPTAEVVFNEAKQVVKADTMASCDDYQYNLTGTEDKPEYKLYYEDYATANISIKEANFVDNDVKVYLKNLDNNSEKEIQLENAIWQQDYLDKDIWENKVTISEEGHYVLHIEYNDRSENEEIQYYSNEIVIDKTAPVMKVEYFDSVDETIDLDSFSLRTAKITITENNFRANDIYGEIIAKNHSDKNVQVDKYIEYLQIESNWTTDGDVHIAEITFDQSANYNFVLKYKDLALRESDIIENEFIVDVIDPVIESVEYSTPKSEKIINNILFGYYKPSVDITITTWDDTTPIEKLSWNYIRETGASNSNEEKLSGDIKEFNTFYDQEDGKVKSKAVLTLPMSEAQLRGNISFVVFDKAKNSVTQKEDRVLVTDTISPTREVEFSEAERIVNAKSMEDVENYKYTTEGEAYKIYYKQSANAYITIKEANFYKEDVEIFVIDVVNNQTTKISTEDCRWKKSKTEDEWKANITFDNEGHYKLKMVYRDRSDNQMKNYISNEIIIDYTKPEIDVNYSPGDKIKSAKGRKYYDENQTAQITITEENFRAADVNVVVTAKDISGNNIKINDFTSYLKQSKNWKTKGEVHTAKITYSKDANYTFDIEYTDLAKKRCDKYKQDKFTIDTKAPTNLKVSYSKSMLGTMLENVSFGFYNAKAVVTIQAEDNISGVDRFVYSYKNDENVSKKNAELLDAAISKAKIKYSKDKKIAVASFTIPRSVLKSNNQFRGKTLFDVYDMAENMRTRKEKKRVVVDSIAPKGTVTLNKPIASGNGGDYYTGDITAKIQIEEANFFKEDVEVRVNNHLTKVSDWKHDGDVWNGSITITGDGHYKLTVDYKDKSQNKMKHYESNQLTIDSQKPEIIVKGIKNQSANKGKKIGFTITLKDENIDKSSINTILKAVCKSSDGEYKTKKIDMGSSRTSDGGKVQTITVNNLTEDAIYDLQCKVSDMAGNSTDLFQVKDSNKQMRQLSFSVNRKGSVFALDDYSKKIVEDYYIQNVNEDIKITEVNVDVLKKYRVELNKEELKEGTDYTVEKQTGKEKWSKYIYSINSSKFKNEGTYSLVVSSTDKAKSTAYSDMKSAEVAFTVDRTMPQIVVSGLEKDGRYQTDSKKVTIVSTDDGGRLEKLKVVVKDKDGNITNVPFELEGEKLEKLIEETDNKLTFDLKEGMYQNVEITCTDEAGNQYTSKEQYYNVTVSPNAFVMFWTNKLLRWGVICGIILIAGFIIGIFLKRKKQINIGE